MTASTVFLLLLVLACPLMMMLMMRGGHGKGHAHDGHSDDNTGQASSQELRRQRDELERLIEQRERAEERELEPTGSGRWRK